MYIRSLELSNYRNYEALSVGFSERTNILYGDNAQGKTNLLEALYMLATTRSYRGAKDRDLVRFGEEEAHIRAVLMKNGLDYRVDMHLRKARAKGIAIDGQRIKKASDIVGLLHIVFFSPEDLRIVKDGPAERRRFMDMELCQLDASDLYDLNNYNRIVEQRNRLVKDLPEHPEMTDTLDLWDEQLVSYGSRIIAKRREFLSEVNELTGEVHGKISGGKEKLTISYEPNVSGESVSEKLKSGRQRDIYLRYTGCGPHRDDFSFISDGIDLRSFGSQGQQRTCALSLKLSEIELVRKRTGDDPILMLDDVLSELDSGRQNYLLGSIGGIQTFITCTGLDEFVRNRFTVDRLYRVTEGTVEDMNPEISS